MPEVDTNNRNDVSHYLGNTMSADYSILCGYSYALHAGYKPKAFKELERTLIEVQNGSREITIRNSTLMQQIQDSYGKLGFLFFARYEIEQINGKHPLCYIPVSYYLYNFIYDCKAFLDAVAVMLNAFYSIGNTRGDIDFRHKRFRDKIMQKEPKLEEAIRKHEDWFLKVSNWRDDLIHRFSAIVAPFSSTENWPTDEELDRAALQPCMMLKEPQPYLSLGKELEKEYGKGKVWREIDPFCKEWIDNACDFYDEVCKVISQALEQNPSFPTR
jgi:hypothetical protein